MAVASLLASPPLLQSCSMAGYAVHSSLFRTESLMNSASTMPLRRSMSRIFVISPLKPNEASSWVGTTVVTLGPHRIRNAGAAP